MLYTPHQVVTLTDPRAILLAHNYQVHNQDTSLRDKQKVNHTSSLTEKSC